MALEKPGDFFLGFPGLTLKITGKKWRKFKKMAQPLTVDQLAEILF